MKHSLQLQLSQHLTLTPQLQQSIRLLQLSTLELNQELERFLQENPLLERDEEATSRAVPPPVPPPARLHLRLDRAPDASTPAENELRRAGHARRATGPLTTATGRFSGRGDDDDATTRRSPRSRRRCASTCSGSSPSRKLPERDKTHRRVLIDSLDDDGYLTQDLDEARGDAAGGARVEREELQIALEAPAALEPAGVGARNLGECLALQLAALPEDTPYRKRGAADRAQPPGCARRARLRQAQEAAALRRRRAARRAEAHHQPEPAARRAASRTSETRYVVPDVIVRKMKGVWVASLNPDAMPKLRINRLYADILQRNRDAGFQQLAEPAAGSEVADQERAAALRHDPARVAGDRRPPAPFLRARRSGDAPARAARDRRDARPARIDRLARDHAEVHAHRRAASSS